MDPILIYGFPAGSSMGLVAALEWLGRPYRLCRVDMLGEMREPPYLRLNPRVETPAFVDPDGRVVTETMAIAAWLEARDDGRRISFDPLSPQADRMHRLMAFINTGFTAAFAPLWQEMEMAGDPAPETRAALKALGREWVTKRQDQLEAMIGDTTFMAGDRPTLADGLLVGVARWLDVTASPTGPAGRSYRRFARGSRRSRPSSSPPRSRRARRSPAAEPAPFAAMSRWPR